MNVEIEKIYLIQGKWAPVLKENKLQIVISLYPLNIQFDINIPSCSTRNKQENMCENTLSSAAVSR